MKRTVTLSKQATMIDGKRYLYWVLRWYGSDGKRHSKHVGKVGKVSKRRATKERDKKQAELDSNPGRREVGRSPSLGEFNSAYLAARTKELAPGTLELHEQTVRYLEGFFGKERRLDSISRADARAFKTALGNNELGHVNKRRRAKGLEAATVDQHIRNARTVFNQALADDLVMFNPFGKLSGTKLVQKDWHYVDLAEFGKLMVAAKPGWKLLFGLARFAALRLEEALELPRRKVDWQNRRLVVISRDCSAAEGQFTPKDRESRVVPICPQLYALLRDAFDPESELVIPAGGVVYKNVWRDFGVIAKRAGVPRYSNPIHSLRKSCITDWAKNHPMHVVQEWAGHEDIKTTRNFYLKVSESEYLKAAGLVTGAGKEAMANGSSDEPEGAVQPSKKAPTEPEPVILPSPVQNSGTPANMFTLVS
jgi:integrase